MEWVKVQSGKVRIGDNWEKPVTLFHNMLGNKYQLIGTYINTGTRVMVRCLTHNIEFEASPRMCVKFKRVTGCPKCRIRRIRKGSFQVQQSKELFFKLLGDNFRLLKYTIAHGSAKVKCLKHGEVFRTHPTKCIFRNRITGCKQCNTERCKEIYVNKDRLTRGRKRFLALIDKNKFEQLTKYKNNRISVKLRCRIHQIVFRAKPYRCNSIGEIIGCWQCKSDKLAKARIGYFKPENKTKFESLLQNRFIQLTPYVNADVPVKLKCIKHDKTFNTNTKNCLQNNRIAGCSKCKTISSPERQILAYIEKLLGEEKVLHGEVWRDKEGRILKPDIVIPDLKIIVEHNGLCYHHVAITGSPQDEERMHYERRKRFEALGYRLIQIWEDDWTKRKSAIKRYLKAQLCGEKLPIWDARKLEIRHPSSAFANKLIDKYHPQGRTYGQHDWISLFDPETKKTVAVMGFSSTSRPVLHKPDTVELTRYASKGRVRGGASRLLVHYLRKNPTIKQIISFSDNDYFDGKMYEAIGFRYDGELKPDYMTIWSGQRRHKSYTAKSSLRRMAKQKRIIFDRRWTEKDCLFFNNILRCWNSGKKRWVYLNKMVTPIASKGASTLVQKSRELAQNTI